MAGSSRRALRAAWLAAALVLAVPGFAAAEATWVFFQDRGAGSVPRPEPDRMSAVAATGARIRTRSAWLNAVSVEASPDQLARIRALPGVRETAPVATARPSAPMPAIDPAAADAAAVEAAAIDPAAAGGAPPPPRDLGGADGAAAADQFSFGSSHRQLAMLGIGEVHAMGYHGEGVLVCVMDTGFELDHEALRHLDIRATRDFINGDDDVSFDPRTDRPGQSSHGTQVLSVIGGYAPGQLVGPAYRAGYLLAKTERSGTEEPVEEDFWCAGLEWAQSMGADLVLSSLSYPRFYRGRDMDGRTAVATRAANIAAQRGLLIVNSVGNAGQRGGTLGSPADAPGVISVGAVDEDGLLAPFSTSGPTWDLRVKPDLCAMGVRVTAALGRSGGRYTRASGTSFSAPLVAGCAALLRSAHPDWNAEAVREALCASADRAARPDNGYGWGVPNARDAILYPLIEGRVTDDATGEPVPGAVVAWEPAGAVDSTFAAPGDSPPRGETRCDEGGGYVVPNLPPGAYRLRISAAGYEPATAAPLEVPPNLGDGNFALRYRER